MKRFLKPTWLLLLVSSVLVSLSAPALAGDGSGALIPIVGGLLLVSVVLIVVYVVLSKKKNK